MDSTLIIKWLKDKRCSIWYLEDFWEDIQNLLEDTNAKFLHVYWEGNYSTDYLAKLGAEGHQHSEKRWGIFQSCYEDF